MPPKKGTKAKTPAKAAAAEVPASVTTKGGKEIETTAAAGRARRATAAPPSDTPAKKAPVKKAPAKAPAATNGKRGRPAKAEAEEADDAPEPPKKRGRPNKSGSATPAPAVEPEIAVAEPKKRGRPAAANAEAAVPKKETAPPKKRGRPPKGGETTQVTADDSAAAEQLEEELVDAVEDQGAPASPVKKARGRPPAKGRGKKASATPAAADVDDTTPVEEEDVVNDVAPSGKQFWLMKAEQEDNEQTLKDGSVYNSKFTIDDLRDKGGPEPWDGVRNPTANKNMKTMKLGDLAFFYASGGKRGRVPGIAGIMEVVKEHEADPSAFNENSAYYEAKEGKRGTLEKPGWSMVHVEYRKKLSKPVTLKELQKYSQDGGVLSNMQEFRAARLSVSKVTEDEWNFIVNELVEGYEEDEIESKSALPNGANGTTKGKKAKGKVDTPVNSSSDTITKATADVDMSDANTVKESTEVPATPLEIPTSTDPLIASEATVGSRAGSKARKPSSRASSLAQAAPGSRAQSRGRTRSRASSVQPGANAGGEGEKMDVIPE